MPTTPYSYLTLSQARQQLAQRLYDASQVFWSPAELTRYIVDALRTWNALTSYWRDDFTFQTSPNIQFYDLADTAAMPNTLRALTLRDTDLYTDIQYHLLEPPAAAAGIASTQFSPSDLLLAVQRIRDEVLSVTGCTYSRQIVPAVPGRTVLPDNVIDIRRVAWGLSQPSLYGIGIYGAGLYSLGTGTGVSVLWPEDTWAMQSFQRDYPTRPAGVPAIYLQSTEPPISFDTDRPPLPGGVYEVLTVNAGPTLSFITPQSLSIPDDWTHVIKWGALADLLSRDSNAKDVTRATYCKQRYQMGLKLLTGAAPALLAMRLANLGISLQVDSMREADLYQTTWEAQVAGTPGQILYAGLNLLAAAPLPDAGPYSLMATVVRNAPVPVADGDFLQVGRDDLEAVLDYAQHLAAFKMGGWEFTTTMPLLQNFLEQASNYGLKLTELGEFTRMLLGLSQGEEQFNPRLSVPQTESQ